MINMETNEMVGFILPAIRKRYSEDNINKLTDELRRITAIDELSENYQEMIIYGIENTPALSGKNEIAKTFKEIITLKKKQFSTFSDLITKYNPYHDKGGRFSSANAARSFSIDRRISPPWGEDNSSLMKHLDPKTGKISDERRKLYNKIINEMVGGINPPEPPPPVLDFMGGGGGSGKGYTVKAGVVKLPPKGEAVQIDSDEIKLKFPEFAEIAANPDIEYAKTAASYVHEESSIIAKQIMQISTKKGLNVIMDGVASDPDKIGRQVAEAKTNGYVTKAHYVAAPTEIAVQDNYNRFYNNPDLTKRRMVPENVIREAHKNVSVNFPKLVSLYDEVEIVTNDRVNSPERIAYKSKEGGLVVTNKVEYQKFIDKGKE